MHSAIRRAHGQPIRFNPADLTHNARFLQDLGQLLSGAPAYQLDYPSDFAAIADVSTLLQSQLRARAS